MPSLQHVTSPDGTRIAYHRVGAGPPLVLAPGTAAANPLAWSGVTPRLAERFTVCALDRRGHGASGDSPAYALAREAEDLAAVVYAQPEPAHLLGHSFGALAALEAALLAWNLRKLVLYEPAFPLGGAPLYAPEMVERYEAQLAAGDRAGVMEAFYTELVGLAPREIAGLRASPAWPERLRAAHAVPREMRAEAGYVFDAGRFAALRLPVLLLAGGESGEFLAAPTRALLAALPRSRLAALPGQGHIAMYTAPRLFVQTVLDFLDEPE
jgi:pimeloyl-ACP methyl ester carboxylesterase